MLIAKEARVGVDCIARRHLRRCRRLSSRLEDFTYFVRITVGGRLLWEGRASMPAAESEQESSRASSTAALRRRGLPSSVSVMVLPPWEKWTKPLRITVVAVAGGSQVAPGHFRGDDLALPELVTPRVHSLNCQQAGGPTSLGLLVSYNASPGGHANNPDGVMIAPRHVLSYLEPCTSPAIDVRNIGVINKRAKTPPP